MLMSRFEPDTCRVQVRRVSLLSVICDIHQIMTTIQW